MKEYIKEIDLKRRAFVSDKIIKEIKDKDVTITDLIKKYKIGFLLAKEILNKKKGE